MYPGKCIDLPLLIISIILFTFPLVAQEESVHIPFREVTRYQADLFWSDENIFIESQEKLIFKERKSPSKAFFYSLLLPGAGEAYVGEKTQSKIFLAVELVAWGLVVANVINVNSRESDYMNYAVQHAQVNRSGKNDQFWIDIGKFDTIFEYNDERRRERDINAIYKENTFYTWNWDKNENRLFYDSQRIDAREIERNRLYFFAAIALNHLVSAINALRLANAYNRNLDELSLKFNIDYTPNMNRFSLSLQKYF
jgi:hypothetical protein